MNQKNLVLSVFGENTWQKRLEKTKKRNKTFTIIDGGFGTVFFEVYIRSAENLRNGFLEVTPGLYRVPDIYQTEYYLTHYNIPDKNEDWFYSVDRIVQEDREILDKYLDIFENGWIEPEIAFGFLPPERYRGCDWIPDNNLSDVYVLSKKELPSIDGTIDEVNKNDLDYRRSDYILPGKLSLYNFVYKLNNKYNYQGTHSKQQIIWQL